MAATVEQHSEVELRERREQLLRATGLDYEVLRERAEAYVLSPEQRQIWETLRGIDYLLGE
jgi:hypothetical protein